MYSTTWPTHRLRAYRVRGVSTLVTAAVDEPVSVDFFKDHGHITDPDTVSDDVLAFRLQAASAWVERYTGRALMPQTWRYTMDGVPECGGIVLLPKVPLVSVTSITSYNLANVGAVYSSASYFVDATQEPGRIVLNDGYTWPSGLRYTNGLVIDYVAGYADEDAVPVALRQAILLLASEWHERIEGATDLNLVEVPFGVKALADPYRVGLDV